MIRGISIVRAGRFSIHKIVTQRKEIQSVNL